MGKPSTTPSSFAACAPTFAGGGMALGPAPAGPACEMRLFSWAQCEKCSKWRRLPPGREPSEEAYWQEDEACTKLHEAMQGTVQMAHLEMHLHNASAADLELPPTKLEGAREKLATLEVRIVQLDVQRRRWPLVPKELCHVIKQSLEDGISSTDHVQAAQEVLGQIVEMEAKLEKLDGTRPAVDVTELSALPSSCLG